MRRHTPLRVPRPWRALILAATTGLVACEGDGPAAGVPAVPEVTPAAMTVLRSASVTLRVVNRGTLEWSYDFCATRLEVLTSSGWEMLPSPGWRCFAPQSLAPGSVVVLTVPVPAETRLGVHRARLVFMHGGDARLVHSRAFEVVGPVAGPSGPLTLN